MTGLALRPRVESRFLATAFVTAALAAATALGWLVLVRRMAGMDGGPGGDPGEPGWFAVSWAAMTVAMMLPAVAPAVLRLTRAQRSSGWVGGVVFLAGYGAVWMLAGLAGYAAVEAVRSLHVDVLGWTSAGRYVAGASVAAAGLYQLTAVKRRWLARCVAGTLAPRGGVAAGVEHGCCCVACCWTLMAALYALGMMSIAWMALLTVLIAGERLLPRRTLAVRAVGVVLVMLGLAVAAAPAAVPALTTSHRPEPVKMGFPGEGRAWTGRVDLRARGSSRRARRRPGGT